jgi:peptidyl-prolyl cis-trans isomerase SurA
MNVFGQRLFSLSLSAAVVLLCAGRSPAATEVLDRIAAVVNGEVLLVSEVDRSGKIALDDIPSSLTAEEKVNRTTEIRKQALNALIDDLLIRQQVRERKIVVTDEEVEQELKNLMEYNKLDNEQLTAALANEGKTMDEFRKELRNQVEQRKLFGMDIQSKVQVGEKDIESYYQTQYQSGGSNEKIHASHILFTLPENCSPEQERAVRAKAEKVLKQIRSGASFAELAKQYSEDASGAQGGDLGWFRRGDMLPNFEKAAFALKPGTVSDVVRTRFGLHLIMVKDRVTEGARPLEEVREEIRGRLHREKTAKAVRDWLDEIRRKSHIEVKI